MLVTSLYSGRKEGDWKISLQRICDVFFNFIIISDMLKIVEASNGRYSVWTVKEKKLRIN